MQPKPLAKLAPPPAVKAAPAPSRPVAVPPAPSTPPKDASLTLRFASDADFLKLASNAVIEVYAYDATSTFKLTPALTFESAPRPPKVRELLAETIPSLVQKALELAPNEPFLIDSLGWIEYRMGRREEALRHLQRAFQARPDAEIAAHLGEVLWVLGRQDEARKVWREGRSRDESNEVLKETLSRLKVSL